jgi:hypothetical protein
MAGKEVGCTFFLLFDRDRYTPTEIDRDHPPKKRKQSKAKKGPKWMAGNFIFKWREEHGFIELRESEGGRPPNEMEWKWKIGG